MIRPKTLSSGGLFHFSRNIDQLKQNKTGRRDLLHRLVAVELEFRRKI